MTDALMTTKRSASNRAMNPLSVKVPPHSIDAEQSVLGGLMLDNRAWDQVADRLHEGDFYRNEHKLIFRIMGRLLELAKPIDVLTVSEALRELHELEQVGGEVYL